MSVTSASARAAARHTHPPTSPGRAPLRRTPAAAPALTLTLTIPLTGDEALSGPARRLLEAARELVECGAAATVGPPRAEIPAPRSGKPARQPVSTPAPEPAPEPAQPPASAGPAPVEVLAASRTVLVDGAPLPLTRLEFDLLRHFGAHPRRVFTRLQLLGAVWGYEHAGVRTVDVHVRRLRRKLGPDVPVVTTVYGVGYRLADEARVRVDDDA
jgi:two-component system, OmpR family, response regulator